MPNDFPNEDLVAMDPADIEDKNLCEAREYVPRQKPFKVQMMPCFPKYFYDFSSFRHPLSKYFYNQLKLRDYNHIRLKDELLDFNCSGNEALETIFNTDLQFHILCEKNIILVEFCERILNALHDVSQVDN